MILITTDLHLTDLPQDEYRWEIFDYMRREHNSTNSIYILGDLTDKKDRHSSRLVNRLTQELKTFTNWKIPVTILRGNHDTPLSGPAYWDFLNDIPGVEFITQPVAHGKLLLLPHSVTPETEWQYIDMNLYDCIMCHYTRSGVDVGGFTLNLEDKIVFPNIPIYSGDIHVPQTLGGITYVGTPHPIKYGEHHLHRMLLLNDDYSIHEEIPLKPIQKHALEVGSIEELESIYIGKGDQVKIKFTIPASHLEQWPVEQEAITQWAKANNVSLTSVEAVPVLYPEEDTTPASLFTPIELFVEYSDIEGVEGDLFSVGAKILAEVIDNENSPNTRQDATVSLDTVVIQDFKSFEGIHEIALLTDEPGLKYIGGRNEITPRRGSNGSGKSAFWDAVVWCWTGFSIRGGRAADLVSWGKKTPTVVTYLTINDRIRYIERRGNPNKLFLDGEPVEQKAIDDLLLSRDCLLQSVIFGQTTKLFYDLSVAERGNLLDEVMNLNLWLEASDKTSNLVVDTNKTITDAKRELAFKQGQLSTLITQEQTTIVLHNKWNNDRQAEIEATINELSGLEELYNEQIEHLSELGRQYNIETPDITALQEDIESKETLLNKSTWELGQCQHSITVHKTNHAFFLSHRVCPTCEQRIPEEFSTTKVSRIEETIQSLVKQEETMKLSNAQDRLNLNGAKTYLTEMSEVKAWLNTEIVVTKTKLDNNERDREQVAAIVNNLMDTTQNPHAVTLTQLQTSIAELDQSVQSKILTIDVLETKVTEYEFWKQTFKKIRLFQIKQVLDRLYLETANAANAIGIGEWKIQYSTEIETKSGTMRPGIHITVTTDGFKVVEDSGGESQRIRLAVAMGLSSLIQNMAGVAFDFEVIDEPTTWLSPEGIEDLLDYLKDRAANLKKSTYLVDQRTLDNGMFDEVWTVTKSGESSRMELIQGI